MFFSTLLRRSLGVFLFFLLTNSFAYDGNFSTYPTKATYYSPQVELNAKVGNHRHLGRAGLLIPVLQDNNNLLFTEIIGMRDTRANTEGNFGLGYRHLYRNLGIWGIYGFYDLRKTKIKNMLHQWTAGMEWLGENYEVRGNVYIPKHKEFPFNSATSSTIVKQAALFSYVEKTKKSVEKPLGGFDIELGHNLPQLKDLYGFVRYYRLSSHGNNTVNGIELRGEYQLLPWLKLEGNYSYDKLRKSNYFAGISLSFNLGNNNEPLNTLEKKMTKMPIRDIDVVTKIGTSFQDKTRYDVNGDPIFAIPIGTYEELSQIGVVPEKPLDGTYVQVANIDAANTETLNPSIDDKGEKYYKGHTPIGPHRDHPFSGEYHCGYEETVDGEIKYHQFSINNLYIDNREINTEPYNPSCNNALGMFGFTDHAKIYDVHLNNIKVTGREKDFVGGQ